MAEMFKKSDIKAGYLLRIAPAEGDPYNVTVAPARASYPFARWFASLMGTNDVFCGDDGELACCGCHDDRTFWLPINLFDDNLEDDEGNKVIAVYGYAYPKNLMNNSTEFRELLWTREEKPEPVEMTLEEIAAELGHPVKIVDKK